ncbi:glycosyltransferase [Escherichia coli]|uniref:glycosyltransferase n=1 Tax=Escherichia coli TaxID=562 RepID=UPI004069438F
MQSVCRQTLDDIEIILVNDGSTNNCLEVCNNRIREVFHIVKIKIVWRLEINLQN